MGKLIIMQGLPGSGKSFIHNRDYPGAVVCSADDYFRNRNPNYDKGGEGFNPSLLGKAHASCFARFMSSIIWNDDIVIDNTNLDNESIAPYVAVAQHYGFDVEICRVKCPIEIAMKRNSHGVPEKAYPRLAATFDRWKIWAPHKFGGVRVREVSNG